MKQKFLTVYDNCADDIFTACYEKANRREIAKYITKTIFMRAWDRLHSTKASVGTIKRTVKHLTREHVRSFTGGRANLSFSDKLWNLTLLQ